MKNRVPVYRVTTNGVKFRVEVKIVSLFGLVKYWSPIYRETDGGNPVTHLSYRGAMAFLAYLMELDLDSSSTWRTF